MSKNKKQEQTLKVDMNSFHITANVDINNTEELFQIVAKEIQKKIKEEVPKFKLTLVDSQSLTEEECFIGRMVEFVEKGKKILGIISKVNKTTIFVATKQGLISGKPSAFNKTEINQKIIEDTVNSFLSKYKKMDKETLHGLKMMNLSPWREGETGYIRNQDKQVVPVILSSFSRGIYKFYPVTAENTRKFFRIDENRLQSVFTSKEEAEKI